MISLPSLLYFFIYNQLLNDKKTENSAPVPIPIAAGTSCLIVISTTAAAAMVQLAQLLSTTTENSSILPINLLCYMCPGVIIGAQIATFIQGEGKIPKTKLEQTIGSLFLVIGVLFLFLFVKSATSLGV